MGRPVITLHADEFADHPSLSIMCHDTPMVMTESVHERWDARMGDVQVHRIVRICPACRAAAITSLIVPVSDEV
jgi:hypothetical protein